MCHLVLLTPIAGLAVFLVLPLPEALAAYFVIAAATALLYGAIIRAMRRTVVTGKEALLGAHASVRRVGPGGLLLHLRGELWTAQAVGFTGGSPQPGESVVITEIVGNRLIVGPPL
ncbi:MAG: NfeD family protein [Actinobacteria bacterium]|nr:NfeD family protein [Actinomycetota bacterium]